MKTAFLIAASDDIHIPLKCELLNSPSTRCVHATSITAILQRTKGQRYRFSLLVQELKTAETEEYVASVLAFINCIIARAPDIASRIKIRNELIGKDIIS